MQDKLRCQSCGMPLEKGYYGTKRDGSLHKEYCMFCFQRGKFTKPDLTLKAMTARSINHMTTKLHFSKDLAKTLSREIIPKLKRWKNKKA